MSPYNSNFNQYNNGYSGYTPPMQNFVPTPPPQPDTSIIWVQGEGGAKAYPVQNGKSVVLFDSESEHFFIKTVDASGMPQPLRIFSYSETNGTDMRSNEIDTSQFITRDEFEEALEKLRSRQQAQNQNNTYQRKEHKNGKPSIQ